MKMTQSTKYSKKTLDKQPTFNQSPTSKWTDSDFPQLQVSNKNKFSDWFPNTSQNPTSKSDDTLLTSQELLSLTTELITQLKSCRTKLDQFQVITKLAIKYTTNND